MKIIHNENEPLDLPAVPPPRAGKWWKHFSAPNLPFPSTLEESDVVSGCSGDGFPGRTPRVEVQQTLWWWI